MIRDILYWFEGEVVKSRMFEEPVYTGDADALITKGEVTMPLYSQEFSLRGRMYFTKYDVSKGFEPIQDCELPEPIRLLNLLQGNPNES